MSPSTVRGASDDRADFAGGHCGWFVFPYPDNGPPGRMEPGVGVSIACHVALDLRAPELGIAPGRAVMLRAAVPKAAVDEDGDLGSGKHEIGGTAHALQWADAD